jgi:site-specific recombinase XerC
LQRFFTHLRSENAVSPHTISAYRDTFRILLRFMAEQRGVSIDQIPWEAFSPDTILAFLQYLETKRLNTARSRNARLAAIAPLCALQSLLARLILQATFSAFLPFHANASTSQCSAFSISTS